MLKSPQCEGKLAAPTCAIDASCEAACQGDAELGAKCTTPTAALECAGTPTADLTKLVATIAKHVPALVQSGLTQGPLALDGATQAAAALAMLAKNASGALGGKALACATSASTAAAAAATSVKAAVQASAVAAAAAGASP
jgi:hypothetical protein